MTDGWAQYDVASTLAWSMLPTYHAPAFNKPDRYFGPPWRLIVEARWRTAMRERIAPTEPAPAPRSMWRPCSATGGFG